MTDNLLPLPKANHTLKLPNEVDGEIEYVPAYTEEEVRKIIRAHLAAQQAEPTPMPASSPVISGYPDKPCGLCQGSGVLSPTQQCLCAYTQNAQPAPVVGEPSDEELIALKKRTRAKDPTQPWGDSLAFARAVLALRSQPVQATPASAADMEVYNQIAEGYPVPQEQPVRAEGGEVVGRVRIDSGEVHIVPRVRDAELAGLTDGQMVYTTPPAKTVRAEDGEAIYQHRMADGSWIDQTKQSYEYNVKHGHSALLRVVYTTPPQAVPMTDEVFDLICGAIDKADTISMKGDYMLDSDDCIAVVRTMQALLSIRHGITQPQQPEQVVPEGWSMRRESTDVIVVQHPALGSARCVIPPTTHHGHMLFMLCDDILRDGDSLPAASGAKGE